MTNSDFTMAPDIKTALRDKGRSMSFAAKFLRVHQNSMSAIAKRKVIPRLDRAARLSVLTGYPLEILYPEFFKVSEQDSVPN